MKKITLMALACAMFMVPSVASAQEVTYVEDPAQGYTFNRFQDNWFIEGLGGAGVMMSKWDSNQDFKDRIGWKGNLFIGKWFSPIIGVRVGGEFNQMKGTTRPDVVWGMGLRRDQAVKNGLIAQQFNNIGVAGDVMINVTNWWCGYRPGRFYNAIPYVGFGHHWAVYRTGENSKGDWAYEGIKKQDGVKRHARNYSGRAGLLNTFRLGEHVNLLLDLRFDLMQEHVDGAGERTWIEYPSALLGLSYKFNKTEWTAPIVPVCPSYKCTDAECDALAARLAAADRKIADLERQLKACLDKPVPDPGKPVDTEAPLAIVYFPINVSKIVGVQNDVVNAVGDVMLDENKTYTLTGWADNYTGNDKINTRLRKDRVATVKNALVKKGVADNRLNTQIDDRNRPDADFGPKSAPLSRAVTIVRNK
jgi:outer membrane protein OmpA-like peptidoglycan-associated protein